MGEYALAKSLGIKYPIIMAPMFLVSNAKMLIAALESGITAAVPALNYRTDEEFRKAILEIRSKTQQPFGVNLIVNKSNFKLDSQLKTCLELKVAFIITSLGSPEEVINKCKPAGIKVYCDVVDLKYAQKVEALGADGLIAVNSNAGGHCGPAKPEELIPLLKKHCKIPVISAGGVATHEEYKKMLALGADGLSIGTVFIASEESPVSADYKNALIQYGAKDIVLTSKLSGSHLTVINTPYVQSLGTEVNWLEKLLKKNKWLKKYVKLFVALRGMKAIEKAAFGATYQTVWCAGPSIEHIHSIRPVKQIVKDITGE
ncbi:MAG: NAD(P)H-dependent flavin oxidoreductase [Flavobacteriales bacterium]